MVLGRKIINGILFLMFSWLARTDPRDVARVESKTFISTATKREAVPEPKSGVRGLLGNWMSPEELDRAVAQRFPGCMNGRRMYLLAYRYPTKDAVPQLGVVTPMGS